MKRHHLMTLLLACCALLVAMPALGAEWEYDLEISSGSTRHYHSDHHPLKRVIIGNPEILHVEVTGKRELILVGRAIGSTRLLLKDGVDDVTTLNVLVSPDVTLLKRRLGELFPNQDIKVYTNSSGVILAGTVTGAEVVEQVLRVARQALAGGAGGSAKPIKVDQKVRSEADKAELAEIVAESQTVSVGAQKQGGGDGGGESTTGTSGPNIVNLLKIGGPQQVLLEVKFAEVNRNASRELQAGFGLSGLSSDFAGGIGVSNVTNSFNAQGVPAVLPGGRVGTTLDPAPQVPGLADGPGSLFVNLADAANVFVNIDNFTLMLRFLEQERLGRVLAEPRLVTRSGQEASFLAGGEFPFPVEEENGITVEFKEFGVGLKFTPIVNSDGMITLRVAPSVSEITELVQTQAGPQPVLSSRKLESTVHLHDGQTLALAGLLSENLSEVVQKVPLLGDIPILGTLFRSTNYQHDKSDLLVAVTPHIVQPVREGEISFPGEFIKPPSRFEFYLEGRLEGRRSPDDPSQIQQKHNFATSAALEGGGMEGDFGHMDTTQ